MTSVVASPAHFLENYLFRGSVTDSPDNET